MVPVFKRSPWSYYKLIQSNRYRDRTRISFREFEMNADQARVLFQEGGTLFFLGVPQGTEFGIDCNSWMVGPNFRGVKMIPPGTHFIYYSSVNSTGQVGPRTGFFHQFSQGEVLVKEWDSYNEDIKSDPVPASTLERLQLNKTDMDRYLGAYPYEDYKKWVSLTSNMSEQLISRLQPINGKICSVTEFVSKRSTSQSRKAEAERNMETCPPHTSDPSTTEATILSEMESRLPKMPIVKGTEIRFSEIMKKKYPPGASPAEMTKYSIDSSYLLLSLIDVYCGDTNTNDKHLHILGEIQFAFVCFLIGQVYDAFEQWKQLVHLVCSSEEALHEHEDLFAEFITVLHFQIREIPQDFFVDIVSSNNFLTTTLQEFFSNVDSSNVDQALKKKATKFREHLTEKFSWDFMSDPEDYAPVVVDLDS